LRIWRLSKGRKDESEAFYVGDKKTDKRERRL